jgi:hypothetical protein
MPNLKIEVSATETLALRAIVTALVVHEAVRVEQSGGSATTAWIRELNASCADMIHQSDIIGAAPMSSSEYKDAAVSCLNNILGGIVIGHDADDLHHRDAARPTTDKRR